MSAWFLPGLLQLVVAVTAFGPKDYLWPLPQSVNCADTTTYPINQESFKFVGAGPGGQLVPLTQAFQRYRRILFKSPSTARKDVKRSHDSPSDFQLDMLIVEVISADASLTAGTDESYELIVTERNGGHLQATTVYGALRGMETFSQLVLQDESGMHYVTSCLISDKPRFQYRGTLIDTARHFIPLEVLFRHLDAMAYNKFNVLHWHIVDDQSFPYQSYLFPNLSAEGAYDQNHIYTQENVANLIEYAKNLGIRVIPEFDTPGHSHSWMAQRDLLTPCYSHREPNGTYGPINPILESTYTFLASFYKEISDVFPDQYVFLGGDEVNTTCWLSNPDIKKWLKEHRTEDPLALMQYFVTRLTEIVDNIGKDYFVWQDVFDYGVIPHPNTVIGVWKNWEGFRYTDELVKLTAAGYKVVLSACWYLNYFSYGKHWFQYYACDPQNFTGTAAQKELVIGGTAAIWGEYVDGTNLLSRLWPRASLVGERLWSNMNDTTDLVSATTRLHHHRCRMLRRGINAEPIEGPGFCPDVYVPPI